MIKKFCSSCKQETWHNPKVKAKAGQPQEYRCVYCGHPISTSISKREDQDQLRQRQVRKLHKGLL